MASFEPKKDSLGVSTTEPTEELSLKIAALQPVKVHWFLSVLFSQIRVAVREACFQAYVNLNKLFAQMQTLLLAQQPEYMLNAQVETDIKARKP